MDADNKIGIRKRKTARPRVKVTGPRLTPTTVQIAILSTGRDEKTQAEYKLGGRSAIININDAKEN